MSIQCCESLGAALQKVTLQQEAKEHVCMFCKALHKPVLFSRDYMLPFMEPRYEDDQMLASP